MGSKIKKAFESGSFRIIHSEVRGNKVRYVFDHTNTIYAEVEKDNIEDPEEFENELIDIRDYFEKAIYISRIRGNDYYLYEIYVN